MSINEQGVTPQIAMRCALETAIMRIDNILRGGTFEADVSDLGAPVVEAICTHYRKCGWIISATEREQNGIAMISSMPSRYVRVLVFSIPEIAR